MQIGYLRLCVDAIQSLTIQTMKTGQIIRKKRLALGATLEQIAHAAKLDASNLSRIERCVQEPSEPVVRRIAKALGLTMPQLYAELDVGAKQSEIGEKLPPTYNRETQNLLRHFHNLEDGNRVLTLEFIKLLERKQAKHK